MRGLEPAVLVAPGQILRRELDARGWSQKDLSDIIDRPVQAISEIVRGTKQITPETAVQLAAAFGTSPEFWSDLEAKYRLRLAKQQPVEPEIVVRQRAYSVAPVSELQRRGWIPRTSSTAELVANLCRFLGIATLDLAPSLPAMNLRISEAWEPQTVSLVSWLKRAEAVASEEKVGATFNRERFPELVRSLRALSLEPEGVLQVPALLASHGIRFVVVPHLSKTYLDGAHFEVNGEPVVALTLRLDRLDNFWFVLFHELAHLHRRDQGRFDERLGREAPASTDEVEAKTNELAGSWLIDPERYPAFLDATDSAPSLGAIISFARVLGVHPAIVLGRLQHDKLVSWDRHRSLLVRLRPLIEDWVDRPILVSNAAVH